MRNLIKLTVPTLLLLCVSLHLQAAQADKDRLILMPIRGIDVFVSDISDGKMGMKKTVTKEQDSDNSFDAYKRKQIEEFEAFKRGGPNPLDIERRKQADAKELAEHMMIENKRLQGAIEEVLVEGLQQNYVVIAGDKVLKASPSAANTECNETPCIEKTAQAFQAQFVAIASISKREFGYLLELNINNLANRKVAYANSAQCPNCNDLKLVIKFKELANIPQSVETKAPVVLIAPVVVPVAAPVVVPVATPVVEPRVVPAVVKVEADYSNCYEDEFIRICPLPADGQKAKIPSFTFVATNLTNETLFIASYDVISAFDDAGATCIRNGELQGVNRIHNYDRAKESEMSRIQTGKSNKFAWRWGCEKSSGNEFSVSLPLGRFKEDTFIKMNVAIPGIKWK
jgi:hypothetical protein